MALNVVAPVVKVAVVLAAPPGETVPETDTEPATVPLPARLAPLATVTEVLEEVLPLTKSVPA